MFFDVHAGLPREGPGDDATTRRALRAVGALPHRPRVLDIGCGPGAQTVVLARETGGHVTAVDLHQPFLDEVARRAREAGSSDAIATVRASMTDLPFAAGSFDLVWSEGAVFVMGFDAGLRSWRHLLRAGGALVVSELTWLTDEPPEPARAFWAQGYPGMRTAAANRAAVVDGGYEPLAEIRLPHASWFTEYLTPLERRLDALTATRAGDLAALAFLAQERAEIDVVRRYGDAFGYVFYVMRRAER